MRKFICACIVRTWDNLRYLRYTGERTICRKTYHVRIVNVTRSTRNWSSEESRDQLSGSLHVGRFRWTFRRVHGERHTRVLLYYIATLIVIITKSVSRSVSLISFYRSCKKQATNYIRFINFSSTQIFVFHNCLFFRYLTESNAGELKIIRFDLQQQMVYRHVDYSLLE